MASYIACADDNFFAQIFSGQGKSIVILLLLVFEIRHRGVKNVLVVTCNEILRDSLRHDLSRMAPHLDMEKVKVVHSLETAHHGKFDLVLVDEADESLKGLF